MYYNYIWREEQIGLNKGEAQIFKGDVLNLLPNLEAYIKALIVIFWQSQFPLYLHFIKP